MEIQSRLHHCNGGAGHVKGEGRGRWWNEGHSRHAPVLELESGRPLARLTPLVCCCHKIFLKPHHQGTLLAKICVACVDRGLFCPATLPPGLAGNYTEYVKQKEERSSQQWVAWEKQQKEIARQVRRLALATACTTPSPSVLFAACSAPPCGHPQARPRSSVPADLFRLTRVHQCCWGAQAARAWSRPTAASPAPLLAGRRRR